ncbi:MAG: hypothetical protein HY718_09785, partial [Planctomycetes bacterium]|nr:hypothetical protein [Planctomycetota bacterium]
MVRRPHLCFAGIVLLAVELAAAAPGTTVCAVIPAAPTGAAGGLAELLEQKLAQVGGITLVNRSDFRSILNEQTLSAAFASEGLQSRVQLGKLVKA